MLVLLDHNIPRPLAARLPGDQVDTTEQNGWSTLDNGFLLNEAEAAGYEAFITGDKNIPFQQNLSDRSIRIIILSQKAWPVVARNTNSISQALHNSDAPAITFLELR